MSEVPLHMAIAGSHPQVLALLKVEAVIRADVLNERRGHAPLVGCGVKGDGCRVQGLGCKV